MMCAVVLLAGLLLDAFVPYAIVCRRGRTEAEILRLANNDVPAADLLTDRYRFSKKRASPYYQSWASIAWSMSKPDLGYYFTCRSAMGTHDWEYSYISIAQLDGQMPLQCLRKVDDEHYYAVYQDRSGAYIYLLFARTDGVYNTGKMIVRNAWFPIIKLYRDDFEQLQVGKTRVKDVKKLDPDTKPSDWDLGRMPTPEYEYHKFSTHYTWDGYHIVIGYDEDMTVANIFIEQASENSLPMLLLDLDQVQ